MRHPLLDRLMRLGLPEGHWALFGSGPLLARGWIDEVGDLDVIVRGPAWDRALELGPVVHLDDHNVDVVVVDDEITIGTVWAIGDVNVDVLIDTAHVVAGVPCVGLAHVAAYKRVAGRPKDIAHLAIIAERTSDDVFNG